MQFNEAELQEFIAIAREEFQQDITMEEAREMTARLLRLLDVLAQPLPIPSILGDPCPKAAGELS